MDIETHIPEPVSKLDEKKETIYFGVISRYSPRSIVSGYQPLMEYLTNNTPYNFKLKLSRNYLETVDQLALGRIDFASLGNYTYIHAHKNYGVRCIAMPINSDGDIENYDDIIVPQNSGIKNLEELAGKSFAFASKQSFSSWMGIWMLKQSGVELADLSRYENLSYHDLVAEKVLRGDFDAGMVKSVVARSYEESGIRILARSPAIPSVPLVAAAHVDTSRIRVVQAALLELSSLIESGEISTSGWDTEVANGFVAGQDSLYNFPRQILDDIEQEM
ncbi:MAG: PhnD/SsuA/transferrin family substrate-binding protein [Candidatus Marinimicrobia bacterium]|jgi:phosphonate transport system substrate-binding protein|nr:PhnD/SsuA/transferrin family substrate-binding protein [Candidatus Neomarinimicrobiota bacterium]MBT3951023.1 PhnD/SsuA/transferrin family substrate-binding protein [Candidatus Neomarinimicrobiota bacterium]MBT6555392.1 PhnD/SsuA/transferrin family substrate-binding protein [Candidatus Neomarinimicrobiota bacterium]